MQAVLFFTFARSARGRLKNAQDRNYPSFQRTIQRFDAWIRYNDALFDAFL